MLETGRTQPITSKERRNVEVGLCCFPKRI